MTKGKTPFTDEQLQYIRERYTEATAREIAEYLGVDHVKVKSCIRKLRDTEATMPKQRPWTGAEINRMRRMAENGRTIAQIARTLGRTYASVYDAVDRNKIRTMSAKQGAIERRAYAERAPVPVPDTKYPEPEGPFYQTAGEVKAALKQKRTLSASEQFRLLMAIHFTGNDNKVYETKRI